MFIKLMNHSDTDPAYEMKISADIQGLSDIWGHD